MVNSGEHGDAWGGDARDEYSGPSEADLDYISKEIDDIEFQQLYETLEPELAEPPATPWCYTVRITLCEVSDPPWRELRVPSNMLLPDFAVTLQAAMGWAGYHHHEFRLGLDSRSASLLTASDVYEGYRGMLEEFVRIDEILTPDHRELYFKYDFGDGWDHHIELLDISRPAPDYPFVTDCARACPPEDCGGPDAFEQIRKWVAADYDPELLPAHFDTAGSGIRWLNGWRSENVFISDLNKAIDRAFAPPPQVRVKLSNRIDPHRFEFVFANVLGHALHGPTEVSFADAARLTRDFRDLLTLTATGVELTPTGAFPQNFLHDLARKTGCEQKDDSRQLVLTLCSIALELRLVAIKDGQLKASPAALKKDPLELLQSIGKKLPLNRSKWEEVIGISTMLVYAAQLHGIQRDSTIEMLYEQMTSTMRGPVERHPRNPTQQTLDILRGIMRHEAPTSEDFFPDATPRRGGLPAHKMSADVGMAAFVRSLVREP